LAQLSQCLVNLSVEDLNQRLPSGYFAEPNAQFGIEIDVATFSETSVIAPVGSVEPDAWIPEAPTATLPFQLTTDVVEVQIFSTQAGPTLVGAIELVSPANKDRPSQRDAFTSKCQTYLQQGIGLIIVDIVTTLSANLHDQLMERLELWTTRLSPGLYAVAYRVAETNQSIHLDLWQRLAVGSGLPMLPLFLKGRICLPIDLDQTYDATCTRQSVV
jgi:hypothetical protein